MKRNTEGYPLIGTAYWKGRQYHLDYEKRFSSFSFGTSVALKRLIGYDAAAVVVYDITDPTNPTWDSGAIAQLVDYSRVDGESVGESEGLAYRNGYVLVSNTADPSVCLLKASWAE